MNDKPGESRACCLRGGLRPLLRHTPHHFHVGARPAREIAGRDRSYRLLGSTVFLLPRRSGPCPR
ncbi:hypothetical protein PCLA_06r0184 [Pseudomonas citronellolis]|nr:hypothetical protein PCLA_06r0184 [Pseudomonas citronellolis]